MTDTNGGQTPTDAWAEKIPEHECIGEGCPYPPGVFFVTVKDDDDPNPAAFVTINALHKIHASTVITALVTFLDQTFQDNRDPNESPVVAFGRGRSLLRSMTDSLNPPGEVIAAASGFMDNINWDLS